MVIILFNRPWPKQHVPKFGFDEFQPKGPVKKTNLARTGDETISYDIFKGFCLEIVKHVCFGKFVRTLDFPQNSKSKQKLCLFKKLQNTLAKR